MRGVSVIAIAAFALLAALLAAPAAAAPNAARNILVFAGSDDPQVVAAINRVDCRKSREGGERKFDAKGRDGGWKLHVRINRFTGFHDYDVEYGIRRANFKLDPPGSGGGFFSNFFFPGDQPPPLSGNLKFAPRGKKMGIAFPAAFSSSGGDEAVALVGNAKCR
jgi:hypothetical protein